MYKKILAAVNEHVNAEVAARYAMHLAKATGARIYLCYVAEKGIPDEAFRHAEESVKRLFHRAREMEVDAESVVATGSPAAEIKKLVLSEGIDLVFTATRHEDVNKRFYEGTTARRLSLSLPCSVALVRVVHLGRIHPGKLLVPLKARMCHISEWSYFTAMLARSFGSSVHLLHLTRPASTFFHGELHMSTSEWEKKIPHDISGFIHRLDHYGITHEKKLHPGRTGRNIMIEAAVKRHDLIIMGASERGLLRSLIRGNPVEEVLKETPCNLIILKLRHEDT
ncbi:MAG: universal stress protein [Nitrospiraceae bacterium]|nr:universal stress protein [Nitrospiraceae bacterium]